MCFLRWHTSLHKYWLYQIIRYQRLRGRQKPIVHTLFESSIISILSFRSRKSAPSWIHQFNQQARRGTNFQLVDRFFWVYLSRTNLNSKTISRSFMKSLCKLQIQSIILLLAFVRYIFNLIEFKYRYFEVSGFRLLFKTGNFRSVHNTCEVPCEVVSLLNSQANV